MAEARIIELWDLPADGRRDLAERAHEELLRPNFPPDELTAVDDLVAGVTQHPEATPVAVAVDGDGRLLGVIVGQWFPASAVLLIAYLAIVSGHRGRGLGTTLIGDSVERWARRLGARLVAGEVEDPGVFAGTPDQDPVARLRLYDRLGARYADVPYAQPALGAGARRVPGLLLVVEPSLSPAVRRSGDGAPAVPSAVIGDFLREYYRAAEGPAYDDAAFAALLSAVEARAEVPLLPLPV
jgi:GNAT superfamily N-acetyltransferase